MSCSSCKTERLRLYLDLSEDGNGGCGGSKDKMFNRRLASVLQHVAPFCKSLRKLNLGKHTCYDYLIQQMVFGEKCPFPEKLGSLRCLRCLCLRFLSCFVNLATFVVQATVQVPRFCPLTASQMESFSRRGIAM